VEEIILDEDLALRDQVVKSIPEIYEAGVRSWLEKEVILCKNDVNIFCDTIRWGNFEVKISLTRTYGENNYNGKETKLNPLLEHSKTIKQNQSNLAKQQLSSMQTSKSRQKIKVSSRPTKESPTNQVQAKSQPRNPEPLNALVLSIFRLGIVGVGLGSIVGTVLANLDLTKPLFPNFNLPYVQTENTQNLENPEKLKAESSETTPTPNVQADSSSSSEESSFSLMDGQRLTSLEQKFASLKQKYPKLGLGTFFVDLDNGAYASFNGSTSFAAASTIKIPVLVAFFEDVDAGKIHLDEQLTMDKEIIGSGAGNMQHSPVGTKYTALETATQMIVISDNTATNMLIRRLGGAEALNQRFQGWGLEHTAIRNWLPDLEGTNTTSAKDLVYLLGRVNNGELVSLRSRDRLLGIMQQTKTKTLLPEGLEKDAVIAHKTGDIGKVLGDAGIIDMPTGKRYIAAVFSHRPHNDYSARTLIQEVSRTGYQHLKNYLPRPSIPQNSTPNPQPPKTSNQSPPSNNQSPTGNNQSPTGNNQSPTGNNQSPPSNNQSPPSNNQSPPSNNQSPPNGNLVSW
jgi:beta-lactamase class A